MSSRSIKPVVQVDSLRCMGCGQCLAVCPSGALGLVDGLAEPRGNRCMGCGHCAAACPEGAVSVSGVAPLLHFANFAEETDWLPFGRPNPAGLVQLMRSRRSCRSYSAQPVARALLEDLIKIGTTAPSGTNCQAWTFSVLGSRRQVEAFGNRVSLYFEKLNRLAAKTVLRKFLKTFGRGELDDYHRRYSASVAEGLRAWREEGRDTLFHGATAAILVGSRPGASCPAEDALLATANILLGAHALGLGTCLIGFAVEAMRRDPAIGRFAGLPTDEKIYAVIALGHPAETYRTVTGRRPVEPRWLNPGG